MKISYCTNIHPSNSWKNSFTAIAEHAPLIRESLRLQASPLADFPLGLGLRLSASAANELMNFPQEIHAFREWMKENHCFVETVNGFPYGNFYGTRIKENVFLPDWTTSERVKYTMDTACILNALLPDDISTGTISTVPISHSSFRVNGRKLIKKLDEICGFLHRLEEHSGRRIMLGMEPEPLGSIDSTQGTVDFFKNLRILSSNPALIEKHLGITYDTCHFAVMGESPSSTLSTWKNENIAVSKIQFSNALELCPASFDDLDALLPFAEPVYSHQTSISFQGGKPILFPDLPDALDWAKWNLDSPAGTRWRVHFHIPLFAEPSLPLVNTSGINEETAKWLHAEQAGCLPPIEVETYTWSALPAHFSKEPLATQIAREMDWLARLLSHKSCISA